METESLKNMIGQLTGVLVVCCMLMGFLVFSVGCSMDKAELGNLYQPDAITVVRPMDTDLSIECIGHDGKIYMFDPPILHSGVYGESGDVVTIHDLPVTGRPLVVKVLRTEPNPVETWIGVGP